VLAVACPVLWSCKLSDFDVEDGAGTGGTGLGGVGASAGSGTGATGGDGTGAVGAGTGTGGAGTGAVGTGAAGTGGTGTGGAVNGGNGGTGGVVPPLPCVPDNTTVWQDSGRCYTVLLPKTEWQLARDECIAWGGDLAVVSTQAEFNFIENTINQDVWVGLRDVVPQDGNFDYVWIDGTALPAAGYSSIGDASWKGGSPSTDDDCIKLHDGFESQPCDHKPADGHVCERAAP